jgi:hypothetical protein
MITFSDLPVDVVDTIIAASDFCSVEALSRVSKSLRQFTEPHLYREIRLKIRDETLLAPEAALCIATDRLAQLLRTLQDRPELAPAIKRVILGFDDYEDSPSIARRFSVDVHDLQPICFRGVLLTFIRQLYGLEYLQIPLGSASHFTFLLLLGPEDFPMRNLKTVCYSPFPQINTWSRHDGKDANFNLLYSLLHAPLLGTLDLVLPGMQLDPTLLRDTTSLKTLILRHSQFSPVSLATLLIATKNLETLQYDYDCDLDALHRSRYKCENDWRRLQEGLKCVAGTLKSLNIALDFHYVEDYKADDWNPEGSWEVRGRLGDISFLEKLVYLEIPLPVLLGWNPKDALALHEVLPRNLLELSLRDDLVDWFEQYPWTPWNSAVIGKLLSRNFHKTFNGDAVLSQLANLASNGETNLQSVTLLMSKDRLWPGDWLTSFARVFDDTGKKGECGIQAKVLLRIGDDDDEEDHDLVREITFRADDCDDDIHQIARSVLSSWASIDESYLTDSSFHTKPIREITILAKDRQEHSHDPVRAITFWANEDGSTRKLSEYVRELRLPTSTFIRHT